MLLYSELGPGLRAMQRNNEKNLSEPQLFMEKYTYPVALDRESRQKTEREEI